MDRTMSAADREAVPRGRVCRDAIAPDSMVSQGYDISQKRQRGSGTKGFGGEEAGTGRTPQASGPLSGNQAHPSKA